MIETEYYMPHGNIEKINESLHVKCLEEDLAYSKNLTSIFSFITNVHESLIHMIHYYCPVVIISLISLSYYRYHTHCMYVC